MTTLARALPFIAIPVALAIFNELRPVIAAGLRAAADQIERGGRP